MEKVKMPAEFLKKVEKLKKEPKYFIFVHEILPEFFFLSFPYLKKVYKESKCPFEFILELWLELFNENLKKFFPSFSWYGEITKDIKAFVFEMPEPKKIADPYFIGFVFSLENENFKPRFFLLEKNTPEAGPPYIFFEYTQNWLHVNYDFIKIKKLTIKDFCKGIKQLLETGLVLP